MSGQRPIVRLSPLSGRVYVVTRYRARPGGGIVADVKHDVTGDVKELRARAWIEGFNACDAAEPGATIPNPYSQPLGDPE